MEENVPGDEEQAEQGREEGYATQTDLTMTMLTTQTEQFKYAVRKLAALEKKVETTPLGLMDDIKNTHKWKYYTGFDYDFIKIVIFPEIEQYVTSTSTTILSPFNQLLLTLVKLRLNLHFKDLAFRFKVAATTASSYFKNIIHIMYECFKNFIIWPDRPESQLNIPFCFRESFQDKTTVIVDCFEVFIEKPENYLTQQQCWSNYKHHHTIKFLIGITPQGSISYISKGWGGRTSDKQMIELGDFCNQIKPGDVVLADRGFLIEETLNIFGAKLVIPAFTKGKSQLHPLEIEATRQIAHVRIHIERIIGVIKNKFRIFKGPLPISMLKVRDNEVCILDKIVTVCSALLNILPTILPP